MLGHFPVPYHDELFYSICARFTDRVQYASRAAVTRELFGTVQCAATVDLPTHIAHLAGKLPYGYPLTLDHFIDKHTLFPLYGVFLTAERFHRLRQYMQGDGGPRVHGCAGIVSSGIPLPENLRFCPVCAEDDRERFGETYWHRAHQIPVVEVCPTHAVWLEQSGTVIRCRRNRQEFISAESAIHVASPRFLDRSEFPKILLALAREAVWLLNQGRLPPDLENMQRRYRAALIVRGLVSHGGVVRRPKLTREFLSFYPPQLLSALHCSFTNVGGNWLSSLVGSLGRAQHPIQHLLLIHFLGHTIESFLAQPTEYQPFGAEPWPCLNTVCMHFHELVIKECQWRINITDWPGGRPVGEFACPSCGFVYTRVGPDQSPEDRFRRGRIVKEYGLLWEGELRRLWEDPNCSVEQMRRRLGASAEKIQKQAARLGLSLDRVRSPRKRALLAEKRETCSPCLPTRERYRADWLSACAEKPDLGRTELLKRYKRLSSWLYTNDAEWLELHLPPRRKPKLPPSVRADWESRDLQLVEQVRDEVARILRATGRPIRVTRAALGRGTGKIGWLQYNLHNLPQTAALLKEVIESYEDFAVRRIWWAAEMFRREKVLPTRWRLVTRAHVEYLVDNLRVNAALQEALRSFQQAEEYVG